ncbi:hypothetical protein BHM03_00041479 [Ensete ventricosum]|nr:hypothetical protein BHM03_00041479 [Ensete ventricosum]
MAQVVRWVDHARGRVKWPPRAVTLVASHVSSHGFARQRPTTRRTSRRPQPRASSRTGRNHALAVAQVATATVGKELG